MLRSKILAVAIFFLGAEAGAEFRIPPLTRPVEDHAGMIDAAAEARIESALRALRESGGTQIAVLTLPNLGGLSINEASIKVAEAWKLGSAEKDDGLLLLIAREERSMRIEVGQGREGELPDALAKRVIDQTMIPLFRSGHVSEGVLVGVHQIIQQTDPKFDSARYLEGQARETWRPQAKRRASGFGSFFIMLIFIVFMLIMNTISRFTRPFGRRRGLFGGGGGFSGGGGGFGGFGGGGGGFSGGGASGRW